MAFREWETEGEIVRDSGGYTQGNMQGNPSYYQSGGLQNLIDSLNTGGGWGKLAGVAGSVVPRKGFGNVAGGALSGAGTGAQIGSMIAPGVGTAIGAGVGAVAGAIGGGVNWKQQQHQKQMEALMGIRNRMQ